jgi:hypothetical protein
MAWVDMGVRERKNGETELVPMAHACNPGYSGVRDQEDLGSKPATGK